MKTIRFMVITGILVSSLVISGKMHADDVEAAITHLKSAEAEFPNHASDFRAIRTMLESGNASIPKLARYQSRLIASGNVELIRRANSFLSGKNPMDFLNQVRARRNK